MTANKGTNGSIDTSASSARITIELGPETLATLTQILTQASAKPTGTLSTVTGIVKEFGGAALRTLMPYLTPYIFAAFTGLGAAAIAIWKVVTRVWFGF